VAYRVRNFLRLLITPAGNLRWGQHPQARMSWLSVVSSFGLAVAMVTCICLKYAGIKIEGPVTSAVILGGFALVFLSGSIDNRRNRR
jgi:hypothetical protein